MQSNNSIFDRLLKLKRIVGNKEEGEAGFSTPAF